MKTIDEVVKELSDKRHESNSKRELIGDQQSFYDGIAELLQHVSDYIVDELKHDNKVEVTNHPEPITEVKVNNFRGLFGILESILKAVKGFKLPNTYKVEGEVTVKNQVNIPEVNIPEYPKEISVNNLSELLPKLDELKKTLSNIKFDPTIEVKNQAPDVQIDLEGVKSGLEAIVEEIKRIPQPEKQEIDFSALEKSVNETTRAIQALRFPVPNVQTEHIATESTLQDILAKIGAPKSISINATNQSEGNLTLSDESNWNVSHSFITSIKVTTASTDWDLWLTDATFSKVLITSRQLAANRSGNFDITVLRNYDSDTNVYLIYTDNSGANTCNILINGEERRV